MSLGALGDTVIAARLLAGPRATCSTSRSLIESVTKGADRFDVSFAQRHIRFAVAPVSKKVGPRRDWRRISVAHCRR